MGLIWCQSPGDRWRRLKSTSHARVTNSASHATEWPSHRSARVRGAVSPQESAATARASLHLRASEHHRPPPLSTRSPGAATPLHIRASPATSRAAGVRRCRRRLTGLADARCSCASSPTEAGNDLARSSRRCRRTDPPGRRRLGKPREASAAGRRAHCRRGKRRLGKTDCAF